MENNKLKRLYKYESLTDLKTTPPPSRSLLSKEYFADIIQTTKGCPFECDFCSVYAFDGQKIRNKTVDQVLKEIGDTRNSDTKFKKRSMFFADDNIIANKKYAKSLFKAIKPFNLNWSCQASINISKEKELLTLMKDSGCGAILIGLESISKKNLSNMNKGVNLKYDYIESIKDIQSHGILVHGSFIVGSDNDTWQTMKELGDFINESDILMPLINVLTPFPGTILFKRLVGEGRILHKDWSKYDTKHVVFKPKLMTPDELRDNYVKLIRSIYSFDNIYNKLVKFWKLDFWAKSNLVDPIKFKYRILFALRLITLLTPKNVERSKFILKILPWVFNKRVRVSTILTLMSYNDYAFSEY